MFSTIAGGSLITNTPLMTPATVTGTWLFYGIVAFDSNGINGTFVIGIDAFVTLVMIPFYAMRANMRQRVWRS